MASITYGSAAALANISRINSVVNGAATTFGEIEAAGEISNIITIEVAVHASAVGGTYDLYLVESHDGTSWTDNIDPTTDTGDVKPKLADATLLASASTVYNASNRTTVEFSVPVAMLVHAKFIGFVLDNSSGQTPGGTSTGNQQALTVA